MQNCLNPVLLVEHTKHIVFVRIYHIIVKMAFL
jgi:hypothetical protein